MGSFHIFKSACYIKRVTCSQFKWSVKLFEILYTQKLNFVLYFYFLTAVAGDEKFEYSQDILDAFELLLQFTPLFDIMDTTCSCNCVECLLNELQKVNLVTEKQAKEISARR